MPIGPGNDSSHDPFAFMATLVCHQLACNALSELLTSNTFILASTDRFSRTVQSSGQRRIFMPIRPDNDSSHDPFAFMATLVCHQLACSALSELLTS